MDIESRYEIAQSILKYVDKQKIKAEIVNTPRPQKAAEHVSPSTFDISIADIVPFVNNIVVSQYEPDNLQSYLNNNEIVYDKKYNDKKEETAINSRFQPYMNN